MSTYLINHLRIPGGIPNEEGLTYLEQVEDTVKAYAGQWLAQGDVQVVEGAWPDSVVLIEFPSHDDAPNWYNSPDYQKIRPLRVNNAISDLILVDHVAPASRWQASPGRSGQRSQPVRRRQLNV